MTNQTPTKRKTLSVDISPARREIVRQKLLAAEPGWLRGTGTLVYDPRRANKSNTKDWLVLEVDREITRLLRWFIDRELMNITGVEGHGVLQPSYDAHISILRGANDLKKVPVWMKEAMWKKYDRRQVDFLYNPHVKIAKGEFFFVDVICPWLLELREWEYDVPFDFGLHLTVAKFRDHWIGKYDSRLRTSHWYGN